MKKPDTTKALYDKSKNPPIIVVFGLSGKGKSTLLNHIFQNQEDAKKKPIFYAKAGQGSVTT